MAKFLSDDDNDQEISPSIIQQKLQSNNYASLFDFYLDVRLLLEPKPDQTNVKKLILEELSQWFTNKIYNIPRSPEEENYMKVKKLISKINYIFKAMIIKFETLPDPNLDPLSSNDLSLASSKIPPQTGQKRIETLQQRIEHLRTPEELQSVLRILQKHIPQLTLGPEVIIEGRYITKACANELRDYLNSVNA
ncbi:hypothetical protein GPJ56_007790 [Histomonas meleagridis]|uniref:uncharacterized protein n=1 Tax=Histomonas meleagridis TaxID=135588 RepID=UPI00355A95E8|nr:hypothetical protein GPJ56_007790 [Histomonas meleagridis]KAH0798731.1 hypothetical protein GO595_008596 [Histomonas meleagridis]